MSILLIESEKKLHQARNILFFVSALTTGAGLLLYFTSDITTIYDLIISLATGVIFLLLALFTNKRPRIMVMSGLILYILLLVIDIVFGNSPSQNGIILKMLIIVALVQGFLAAKQVEEIREKMNNLNTLKDQDKPLDQMD